MGIFMKPNNKILKIATFAMVIASPILLSSCKKEGSKEASLRAPQSVNISEVSQMDFSPKIIISGQVMPQREAKVYSTITGGKIMNLYADVGDYVKKGQVLATIDTTQAKADSELLNAQVIRAKTSLSEAEVALANSRQTLNRTLNGPKETNLSFEQAQSAYTEAKSQYDRALATTDVGSLSKEEVERRKSVLEQAKARLKGQEGDVVAVLEQRKQAVKSAQARVASAKSDLLVAIAQKEQSDSRQNGGAIVAPVSGVISERSVSLGDITGGAASPMFKIIENNALDVQAEVAEGELNKLSLGMGASFKAPDGTSAYGTLRQMPAKIDDQKRTGIAKFAIEATGSIKSGVFVTGEAISGNKMVASIPATSVIYNNEGASVYVVGSDNKVMKQKVTLGSRQGNYVELIEGPAIGSWIVSSGGSFLSNGEVINPIKPKANQNSNN